MISYAVEHIPATHSSYVIKGLWSGGMVDRGSDITSSHRDSERADTLSNVTVGKHEFPL